MKKYLKMPDTDNIAKTVNNTIQLNVVGWKLFIFFYLLKTFSLIAIALPYFDEYIFW